MPWFLAGGIFTTIGGALMRMYKHKALHTLLTDLRYHRRELFQKPGLRVLNLDRHWCRNVYPDIIFGRPSEGAI